MNNLKDNKLAFAICASIYYIKIQARQSCIFDRIYKTLHKYHGFENLSEEIVLKEINNMAKDGFIIVYEKNRQICYKVDISKLDLYDLEKAAFRREFKRSDTEHHKLIFREIQKIFIEHGKRSKLSFNDIFSKLPYNKINNKMNNINLTDFVKLTLSRAVSKGALRFNGIYYELLNEIQFLKKNYKDKYSNCSRIVEIKSNIKDISLNEIKNRAILGRNPARRIMICSICIDSNKDEELLFCFDCGRSGHPSCLGFSDELTTKVKTLKWQCIECKRCSVCVQEGNEHLMLFCDACDRGFHMDCCDPKIQQPPEGEWICCICSKETSIRLSKKPEIKLTTKLEEANHENSDESDIEEIDLQIFSKMQQSLSQKITELAFNQKMMHTNSIVIGKYEIFSWYSSPFPEYILKNDRIYFCEFCLLYFSSLYTLRHHMGSCYNLCPPGNEIYCDEEMNISVFEVDGQKCYTYCRNLCLLAKLFIDHKTVYLDVELFFFYVLTRNDGIVKRIVGYFSKEKFCHQNYNLSCIATFPQYQRCGYGYFLIAFSYLLSRKTEIPGSPEKPLSLLGKLSYEAFWKSTIIEYFSNFKNKTLSLKEISTTTGMCIDDIVYTLQLLNILQLIENQSFKINFCQQLFEKEFYKFKSKRINLDESKLVWTPYLPNSTVDSSNSTLESANLSCINDTPKSGKQSIHTSPNASALNDIANISKITDVSKYTNLRIPDSLEISSGQKKKNFKQFSFRKDEQPLICSTPVKYEKFPKSKKSIKGNKRKALYSKTNQNLSIEKSSVSNFEDFNSFNLSRFNLRSNQKLFASLEDKNQSNRSLRKNRMGRKKFTKKLSHNYKENLIHRINDNINLNSVKNFEKTFKESSLAKRQIINTLDDFKTTVSSSIMESNNNVIKVYNTRCSNALKKFEQYDGINHRKSLIGTNKVLNKSLNRYCLNEGQDTCISDRTKQYSFNHTILAETDKSLQEIIQPGVQSASLIYQSKNGLNMVGQSNKTVKKSHKRKKRGLSKCRIKKFKKNLDISEICPEIINSEQINGECLKINNSCIDSNAHLNEESFTIRKNDYITSIIETKSEGSSKYSEIVNEFALNSNILSDTIIEPSLIGVCKEDKLLNSCLNDKLLSHLISDDIRSNGKDNEIAEKCIDKNFFCDISTSKKNDKNDDDFMAPINNNEYSNELNLILNQYNCDINVPHKQISTLNLTNDLVNGSDVCGNIFEIINTYKEEKSIKIKNLSCMLASKLQERSNLLINRSVSENTEHTEANELYNHFNDDICCDLANDNLNISDGQSFVQSEKNGYCTNIDNIQLSNGCNRVIISRDINGKNNLKISEVTCTEALKHSKLISSYHIKSPNTDSFIIGVNNCGKDFELWGNDVKINKNIKCLSGEDSPALNNCIISESSNDEHNLEAKLVKVSVIT